MSNGFLDDLPDLWPDQYSRKEGIRRKSIPAEPYFPKPVDYPADYQKLTVALMNDETRRKWREANTRVFKEAGDYDKKWTDDPDNPFPIEWLKGRFPYDAIKRRDFNKLSEEDYSLWRRIVKEQTGLNVMQGSDKVLKIFEKKQAKYWEGHRTFYILEAEKVSRIVDDGDLLCCVLGIYHDCVCEFAPKVATDEIRNLDLDTYKCLMYFAGKLNQAKLQTLLVYAESKEMLEPVDGVGTSIEEIKTNASKIPWNEKNPNFYENKKAIDNANKVGNEHDIDELKNLDYDKLGKLLRKPACTIRYMSVKLPRPRGKVHRIDWQKYLKGQIKEAQKLSKEVEQEVLKRMQ